jgi:hypothetical protein
MAIFLTETDRYLKAVFSVDILNGYAKVPSPGGSKSCEGRQAPPKGYPPSRLTCGWARWGILCSLVTV